MAHRDDKRHESASTRGPDVVSPRGGVQGSKARVAGAERREVRRETDHRGRLERGEGAGETRG